MSYHNLGDANIIDRALAHPKALNKDIAAAKQVVNMLFVPLTASIPSFDFFIPTPPGFPRIGVTKATINKMKSDPFGMLFDLVQNSRDFVRELINRVAVRSGKNTRSVGGTSVPMQAKFGDSIFRTMAQLIMLMTTDWFAVHDELARMVTGQPRGTKGILGALGDGGLVSLPVATAATPAATVTLAEATAMLGSIAAFLGALRPIIDPLLNLATKDESAAASASAAADKLKADTEAKQAAKDQAKVNMQAGGIGTGTLVAGALAVFGVGYLVLGRKGRKS